MALLSFKWETGWLATITVRCRYPAPVGDDHELHAGQGSNLFFQLRSQMKTPVTTCFLEAEFMDNPAVEQAILRKSRPEVFDALAAAIAETAIRAAGK